jgi:hypothetical protein
VQRLGRSRLVASLLVLAGLLVAPSLKNRILSEGRYWHDIADEPAIDSVARFERNSRRGRAIHECIGQSVATVMVQGGQVALAYYARPKIAVEITGLTDRTIAHTKVEQRGRPGHEKTIEASYVYSKPIHLRFHYGRQWSKTSAYARLSILLPNDTIQGEILVYDREVMESLRSCRNLRFHDFPNWLATRYLPTIARIRPERLREDYREFHYYYFKHNPDPEGLLETLRQALAQRGIHDLQEEPTLPQRIVAGY